MNQERRWKIVLVEVERLAGRGTILIVDDNLGFVVWAGRMLTDAGYAVMPAESVRHAKGLVDDHRLEISVLMVNPLLRGIPEFIDSLRAAQKTMRVVALEQPMAGVFGVQTVVSRPTDVGIAESAAWLKRIERLCF